MAPSLHDVQTRLATGLVLIDDQDAGGRQVLRRVSGQGGSAIGSDFVEHFADSYRIELAAWADASLRGEVVGASAWDGYVANVVAAAGVDALRSGQKRDVVVPERPSLYA